MRPYKTYIDPLYSKFYNNDQTMVVSSYIKNIMLISNAIYTIIRTLNVGEVSPICLLHRFYPILQSHSRIRKAFDILFKRFFCYYTH